MLEKKHHVCDLESTETVKCSTKVKGRFSQGISWYDGSTGVKIKSGGRIELKGLSLKINNVQLDDAGTYECRGTSSSIPFMLIVSIFYSPVVRHFGIIFVTPHPDIMQ